jgi:L-threonylcarbamoyladenylate synthase
VEIAPIGQGPTMAAEMAAAGSRVGLLAPDPAPPGVTSLGRPTGPAALARCLYAALRAAELAGLEVVVVEAVPEEGMGAAVMDRLERAAAR